MSSKKFYKIQGAHNIFDTDTRTIGSITYTVYDTLDVLSTAPEVVAGDIDEETILFVTCDSTDEGRYVIENIETSEDTVTEELHKISAYNTFIWAKGDVYSFSEKTVTKVEYSGNNLVITYSDLSQTTLTGATGDYTAGTNISISSRVISATGYAIDANNNSIFNNSTNTITAGSTSTVVLGDGNTGYGDGQTVVGKYNTSDDDQAFIIGNGTSTVSSNLFTISNDGVVKTIPETGDVIIGNNTVKLSDLHKVTSSDWGQISISDSSLKKFATVEGLHNIFNFISGSSTIYDVTALKSGIGSELGENTIIFITADSTDEDKQVGTYTISEDDTLIWTKGAIYNICKVDEVVNTWRPIYIAGTTIGSNELDIQTGTDLSVNVTSSTSEGVTKTTATFNVDSTTIQQNILGSFNLTSPDNSITITNTGSGAWQLQTAESASISWGEIGF